MNILDKIQILVPHHEIEELITKLGYQSSHYKKVKQAITELLDANDIDVYFDKSYYDFKYSSRTLLKAICRVLGIPKIDYSTAIEIYDEKKRRLKAFASPYIFVDTYNKVKYKRTLGFATFRRKRIIDLDKELYLSRSEEEMHRYVSCAVKLHYKWRGGKLPMGGAIRAYFYYGIEGNRTVYSVRGEVIEDDSIQESRATTTLNNRIFIRNNNGK